MVVLLLNKSPNVVHDCVTKTLQYALTKSPMPLQKKKKIPLSLRWKDKSVQFRPTRVCYLYSSVHFLPQSLYCNRSKKQRMFYGTRLYLSLYSPLNNSRNSIFNIGVYTATIWPTRNFVASSPCCNKRRYLQLSVNKVVYSWIVKNYILETSITVKINFTMLHNACNYYYRHIL